MAESNEGVLTTMATSRAHRVLELLKAARDVADYQLPRGPGGKHAGPAPAAVVFLEGLAEEIEGVLAWARRMQRHLPPRPQEEEK